MAPTLYWFGRHDERIGILSPLGAVLHREELGGEDAIEIACREEPTKYDRLLWHDPEDGRWREHVVVTVEGETGGPSFVRAESSLCDLLAGYIESARLTNAGVVAALSAARLAWGLPDADGTGRVHRFGEVTFADVEDPQTLKERTLAALPEACVPKVRYEVDAALVAGSERAGLGDDVAVVDASRDPEWRFKSRVVGRARTFGDGWVDVQLTIGQPKSTAYAAASEATARATAAEDAAGAAGDVALAARSGVDALNEAAGTAEDGTVPALATKAYVDAAIAALDDLSEVEF